ncbi:hypothetical protein [Actinoplanes sp. NPDC049599]|uniref:hypothetical protein n=1 Tax=Actinoplanes sp. NPDC049599 TaxID=3363903 RepID=UPI0037ACB7D7
MSVRSARFLLATVLSVAGLTACQTTPDAADTTPPDLRLVANPGSGAVTLQDGNSPDHPDPLPVNPTLTMSASASDGGGMSVVSVTATVRWQCVNGTAGTKVVGPVSATAPGDTSLLVANSTVSADAVGPGCTTEQTLKLFTVDVTATAENVAGLAQTINRHWKYVGPPDFTIVPYDNREFLGVVEQEQTWCGSFTPPNPPCLDLTTPAMQAIIKANWLLSVDSVIFETRDKSVRAGQPFDILFTVKNSGKQDSPPDARITWFVHTGNGNPLGKLVMQRSTEIGPVLGNPDLHAFLMLSFSPLNAGDYTLRASIDKANPLGSGPGRKQVTFAVLP